MAAGQIYVFRQFLLDMGKAQHDLSSDTLKLMLCKPSASGGYDFASGADTPDPRYGPGGVINLTSYEVQTGSGYAAGGATLAGVTWTLSSGIPVLTANIVSFTADVTNGFADARWGVIYNDSHADKKAILLLDFGGNQSNVPDAYPIDWAALDNRIMSLS